MAIASFTNSHIRKLADANHLHFMTPRHLINDDGTPFDPAELNAVRTQLDALPQNDRERYRNENGAAIALHPAERMLIVSGPGTGKSHLFLNRIGSSRNRKPASLYQALSES